MDIANSDRERFDGLVTIEEETYSFQLTRGFEQDVKDAKTASANFRLIAHLQLVPLPFGGGASRPPHTGGRT